jgi:cation transport regulator
LATVLPLAVSRTLSPTSKLFFHDGMRKPNEMPCSIADLPPGIREYLPPHAQEIFVEAFNHAWEEYASPKKRYAGSSQEETATRVAWAAVKRSYVKAAAAGYGAGEDYGATPAFLKRPRQPIVLASKPSRA